MKKNGSRLYFWVLLAIVAGVLMGWLDPTHALLLKPLGDAFIALVKMMIGPMIFCTVVLGVSGAGSLREVGRVGSLALLYFEVVSTVALALGLVVMNVLRPGHGFHVDPATLDPHAVAGYAKVAAQQSVADFLLHSIPHSLTDAFSGQGDMIQVLLVALLFGFSLSAMGEHGAPVRRGIEQVSTVLFGMMNGIMKLAPLGAGGAMAFTVGKYGVHALAPLMALMGVFYLSCVLFIGGVLGLIGRLAGFSLPRFLWYLREELLTVLGTSSSETVLIPLMNKLELAGCPRAVVGLVVPAGYSFNLDGTNLYLTMAALFVAQALDVDLTLGQQVTLLGVAMLTSKGASGVTGAGFVTLAATLAVVPSIPVAGLTLILGIDRFMSEARAITNFIGNGVAAIVVSRWEGKLDTKRLQHALTSADGL